MARISLEVDGLDEFQAGLREASRTLSRETRRANKEVAVKVADWSQARARGGTRAEARFAGSISGRSTVRTARIAVSSRGRNGGAIATYFGQRPRTRTGWNAATYRGGVRVRGRRYIAPDKAQAPTWVGNDFAVGVRGQGPRVINDTIAAHMPEIEQMYLDVPVRAASRAFNEGGK